MQKIVYSLVSPTDTGLKTLESQLMLKKQTFNNKVVFKEKCPKFCDQFKLDPDNPELSVEELKFST